MAEKIKDLSSVINIDGADYNIHAETAKDAEKLGGRAPDDYALKTELFSKNYNDLTNKPTIPTDTNQKVKTGTITFGSNDTVEFVAGSNVTITGDAANKKITISSTGGGGTNSGDMLKSVYDTNNNNKVDVAENAENLGGTAASEYVKKTDLSEYAKKTDLDLSDYVLKTSITVSQDEPSDGAAGDIWFKYLV